MGEPGQAGDNDARGLRRERAVAVVFVVCGVGFGVLAVFATRRGDRVDIVFDAAMAILLLSTGVRHVVRYWVRAGTGAPAPHARRAGPP